MGNQWRDKLLEIILEKCFRLGDFVLASGAKSDYYIDARLASLDSTGVYCIANIFLPLCSNYNPTSIGGLTLGADPIIGAMLALGQSYAYPLKGFIVRKKQKQHGAGKLIEGSLGNNDKVVIIEDIVTSGGSSMKAVEAARAVGADVWAVLAVVDREQGGSKLFQKEGLAFEAIFTATELKQAKKEKTLCNSQQTK